MTEEKEQKKTAFYKKRWFRLIVFIILCALVSDPKSTTKSWATGTGATAQVEKVDDWVSREFKNALKKAKSYCDTVHMSKQWIYDQLTSSYWEWFEADAAQYAIDNVDCDYKENALKKANDYLNTTNMSKANLKNQLTSQHWEKFTAEEAQYAIDNLE